MRRTIYLTYDLQQGNDPQHPALERGAKRVDIEGDFADWRAGEFESAPGKKVYGVRIRYHSDGSQNQEIVEIPANAQNVNIHTGNVPRIYREALLKGTA